MLTPEKFGEVFELEMLAWVKGVESYPGEFSSELIHAVIKEMHESFRDAIKHLYVFNLVDLSEAFSQATRYQIHPKEVCFHMLVQLPNPKDLNEDEQITVADVVDLVEKTYPGALARLEKRWCLEIKERVAA